MQLASVSLARYYGLVQIEDLNLGGTVYLPEVCAALVQRYGFLKYPNKPEEFDEGKGIEFSACISIRKSTQRLPRNFGMN